MMAVSFGIALFFTIVFIVDVAMIIFSVKMAIKNKVKYTKVLWPEIIILLNMCIFWGLFISCFFN